MCSHDIEELDIFLAGHFLDSALLGAAALHLVLLLLLGAALHQSKSILGDQKQLFKSGYATAV